MSVVGHVLVVFRRRSSGSAPERALCRKSKLKSNEKGRVP